MRFVHAAGGWPVFQGLLAALSNVARKHGVGIAAVAIRWVLDIDVVKAAIIGCRLDGSASRRQADANLAAFAIALDPYDRDLIATAQARLHDIPGDCGDEYRRPPFLTAAGDLSDHAAATSVGRGPLDMKTALILEEAVAEGRRIEYHSNTKWEPITVESLPQPS